MLYTVATLESTKGYDNNYILSNNYDCNSSYSEIVRNSN